MRDPEEGIDFALGGGIRDLEDDDARLGERSSEFPGPLALSFWL